MLQRIRELILGKPMTVEERQEALLYKEAASEVSVLELDAKGSLELIRQFGFPVRSFYGTRIDN